MAYARQVDMRTATVAQRTATYDLLVAVLGAQTAWTRVRDLTGPGETRVSVWGVASTEGTGSAAKPRPWVFTVGQWSTGLAFAVSEGWSGSGLVRPAVAVPGADTGEPSGDFSATGTAVVPILTETGVRNPAVEWRALGHQGVAPMLGVLYVSSRTFFASTSATVPAATTMGFVGGGLFEPFLDEEPFPLFIGSNGSTTHLTRFPYVSVAQTGNWQAEPVASTPWTARSGVYLGAGDRLHNQRPVSARLAVLHKGAVQTHGRQRGLFNDLCVVTPMTRTIGFTSQQVWNSSTRRYETVSVPVPGADAQVGDQVLVNDRPWVVLHAVSATQIVLADKSRE